MFGGDDAPIGIVTVGRAHEDTMHALRMLDLEHHAQIALYKVAMTWPLETEGLREFARGKRALLVIEEKRSFVESQIRDALYHLPADRAAGDQRQDRRLRRAAAVAADGAVAGDRRRRPCRVPALGRPERRATRRRRACRSARRACCAAFPRSAPAARTARRRSCRRAVSPPPASAATSWRSTTATRPAPSPIWAARARRSSAWRRSPTRRTCSPTWATAPTRTPASWRSARRSRRAPASPTSCWSTTRWR